MDWMVRILGLGDTFLTQQGKGGGIIMVGLARWSGQMISDWCRGRRPSRHSRPRWPRESTHCEFSLRMSSRSRAGMRPLRQFRETCLSL